MTLQIYYIRRADSAASRFATPLETSGGVWQAARARGIEIHLTAAQSTLVWRAKRGMPAEDTTHRGTCIGVHEVLKPIKRLWLCGLAGLALLPALIANGASLQHDLRRIRHVYIIVLENKSFRDSFGASTQDPYLQKSLPAMGALLTEYYGTGHASLDNYIALISGQASAPATEADCMVFADFHLKGLTSDGQAIGDGCVYPSNIMTLPNQLKGAGFTWKGYMEDMGNDPARENAVCGHAALNTKDLTQSAQAPSSSIPAGDQYAARHNPFVYFHSIIDTPECANVVSLGGLEADLSTERTTPNFVFITPNLCNDGHDGDGTGTSGKRCVDGKPGGLASADAFLRNWVPKILTSPAYLKDGLLIITFDEGNYSVPASTIDPENGKTLVGVAFAGNHCCNQQIGPNVVRPFRQTYNISPTKEYVITAEGYGGDRVGAVLISPFIKPGTVSAVPYNHYSLLKSLESIYGLSYLGYAGQPHLTSLGRDVFGK